MYSEKDRVQIERHGLTVREVEKQMRRFRDGFPFLPVLRPARIGDGIRMIRDAEMTRYIERYDNRSGDIRVVKFVPASGAATRMFKELFEFTCEGKQSEAVGMLLENLSKFAFYDQLKPLIEGETDPQKIVSAIVGPEGLGYGSAPKALILFHAYPDGNRTALEEHLVEGALYAASQAQAARSAKSPAARPQVRIHFTVSPEHRAGFDALLSETAAKYEAMYGVTYHVSFSYQDPSTDTVAATPENEPFRDADGNLVFRPAGHGALIRNLNDLEADLVFIKTVDNVQPDRLKNDTVACKKMLGGVLIDLQEKMFGYLEKTDRKGADRKLVEEIVRFVEEELFSILPGSFYELDPAGRILVLRKILDRPLRVCGMVKNEGEPGGGPFWSRAKSGTEKLQIAESSQIAPGQQHLMREATHFNPVDLVCGLRDYKGGRFDLLQFVDEETGFISTKSKDGRTLKAQELPGLWNGAMSKWNTVFVEVPITTFTPVKVVNDLLRPQHRNQTG